MKPRNLVDLLILSALWGASFLFMRLTAPEFGPLPVAGLRVTGAALVLLPLLAWRKELGALRQHWKPLLVVGFTTSAFPFALYAYAALTLNAGLASIFNAATPLFSALIAYLWWRELLSRPRVLGLLIGFVGVFGLAYAKAGFHTRGEASAALAVGACILATVSYGFSANYTKHRLSALPSIVVAAGSQVFAALLLALPMAVSWPETLPSPTAWLSVALLAVACTGLAYLLFFRLIAQVGPAKAVTVTFLVPAFAVAWGGLFLGERITLPMVVGCAVILVGTALSLGMLGGKRA